MAGHSEVGEPQGTDLGPTLFLPPSSERKSATKVLCWGVNLVCCLWGLKDSSTTRIVPVSFPSRMCGVWSRWLFCFACLVCQRLFLSVQLVICNLHQTLTHLRRFWKHFCFAAVQSVVEVRRGKVEREAGGVSQAWPGDLYKAICTVLGQYWEMMCVLVFWGGVTEQNRTTTIFKIVCACQCLSACVFFFWNIDSGGISLNTGQLWAVDVYN